MTEQLPLNTSPLLHKLRVEDYLTLDGLGAFADYAKTELIEGEIFFMNAQHRPHARVKMDLYDALRDALRASGSMLRPFIEASVAVPPHNVPEPDIVLTSEPEGDGLIPLSSIPLVIEVADTSLESDLGVKSLLYARNGIPEYWVADVNGRVIHQMSLPTTDGYAERREIPFGEAITSHAIADLAIDTVALQRR